MALKLLRAFIKFLKSIVKYAYIGNGIFDVANGKFKKSYGLEAFIYFYIVNMEIW